MRIATKQKFQPLSLAEELLEIETSEAVVGASIKSLLMTLKDAGSSYTLGNFYAITRGTLSQVPTQSLTDISDLRALKARREVDTLQRQSSD